MPNSGLRLPSAGSDLSNMGDGPHRIARESLDDASIILMSWIRTNVIMIKFLGAGEWVNPGVGAGSRRLVAFVQRIE